RIKTLMMLGWALVGSCAPASLPAASIPKPGIAATAEPSMNSRRVTDEYGSPDFSRLLNWETLHLSGVGARPVRRGESTSLPGRRALLIPPSFHSYRRPPPSHTSSTRHGWPASGRCQA